MLHETRIWSEPLELDIEAFAEKVTQHTWTVCTAFKVGEYVFVNDATSGDGAQEYAVLVHEPEGWFQIESWTCSWMEQDEVAHYFAKLPDSTFHKAVEPVFEEHGYGTEAGPRSCCA